MGSQDIRQRARRQALGAAARQRKERALRGRRLQNLAVQILTALGERDAAVTDTETRAGNALAHMTAVEGLTLAQAVEWCGQDLSVRKATRLRQLSTATQAATQGGAVRVCRPARRAEQNARDGRDGGAGRKGGRPATVLTLFGGVLTLFVGVRGADHGRGPRPGACEPSVFGGAEAGEILGVTALTVSQLVATGVLRKAVRYPHNGLNRAVVGQMSLERFKPGRPHWVQETEAARILGVARSRVTSCGVPAGCRLSSTAAGVTTAGRRSRSSLGPASATRWEERSKPDRADHGDAY